MNQEEYENTPPFTHPFRYDVAYIVPALGSWHVHEDIDFETLELLAEVLLSIKRRFLIRTRTTIITWDVRDRKSWEAFLLNLFSIGAK